jgi:acetolactate synthase-1/2/3 large subunit
MTPLVAERTALREACERLVEAGIDHVFGIPGGSTVALYDALGEYEPKVRLILTRHEQAAACMADAFGRITGRPALVMGQGPFISTSAAFGMAEALASGSPMLVVTDASTSAFAQHGLYQSGSGDHGTFDLRGMLRATTKFSTVASTPREFLHGLQFAIKHALTPRRGPAAVLMKDPTVLGPVDLEQAPRVRSFRGLQPPPSPVPQESELRRALALLSSAERPVIIAGNGVHGARAYAELQACAEWLGAPVTTSYKGKGVFPETHPLALGMMGGFGQPAANRIVAEADVLLVVACHLGPSDTCFEHPALINPDRQRLIQIDVDARNIGWTFPVEAGLVGDAAATLTQLMHLAAEQKLHSEGWAASVAKIKAEEGSFTNPSGGSDAVPMLPQALVRVLNETVPANAIVTLDAGSNRVWSAHFYQTKQSGGLFSPAGNGGMGWGAPAAVAIKLVRPDQPVFSVAGDGGFAMTMNCLSTAVQYGAGVIFVVMNDSALGMVAAGQKGRKVASEFVATDFARIAEGFGCRGFRVSSARDLASRVAEALVHSGPTVIDAQIDTEQSFLQVTSPLAGRGEYASRDTPARR